MDAFQRIINPVFINLVKQYAKKNQVSSYRVWLGIYLILLHQMTNQTDLTVEIPINIRSRDNKEQHVFGYFVNAVPLCIQLATDETFSEFVQKRILPYKKFLYIKIIHYIILYTTLLRRKK